MGTPVYIHRLQSTGSTIVPVRFSMLSKQLFKRNPLFLPLRSVFDDTSQGEDFLLQPRDGGLVGGSETSRVLPRQPFRMGYSGRAGKPKADSTRQSEQDAGVANSDSRYRKRLGTSPPPSLCCPGLPTDNLQRLLTAVNALRSGP